MPDQILQPVILFLIESNSVEIARAGMAAIRHCITIRRPQQPVSRKTRRARRIQFGFDIR